MSEKKPIPTLIGRNTKVCPFCGKTSYSQGGIHPQCAMAQADRPRRLQLAADKKALAEGKAEAVRIERESRSLTDAIEPDEPDELEGALPPESSEIAIGD